MSMNVMKMKILMRKVLIAVLLALLLNATLLNAQDLDDGQATANEAGEQAGVLADEFGANDKAKEIADAIPRFGGQDEFDFTQEYLVSIIVLGIPGFIMAGLVIWICLWFTICRCCCNKCGGRKPNMSGYSKKKRFFPWIIHILFLLIAIVFCSLGWFNNDQFHISVVSSDDGVLDVLMGVIDDTSEFTTELQEPLNDINANFSSIVDDIILILDSTSVLENGTKGLTDRLDEQSFYMDGLTIETPNGTYLCEYCSGIATEIASMADEIRSKADPAFEELATTVDPITSSLIASKETTSALVESGNDQLDMARETIIDYREDAGEVIDTINGIENLRHIVVTLIFALPLISFVLVIIGALCKFAFFFRVNCCATFLVTVLMFLLFSVHLPLSVVLGDFCVFLDESEEDLVSATDPQIGGILDACLNNGSLSDALNLTQALSFRNLIDFGDIQVGDAFDFSELDSFASEVNNLTVSTFGYDPQQLDDMLLQFSTDSRFIDPPVGAEVWTRDTIDSYVDGTDPGSFGAAARDNLQRSILDVRDTEITLQNAVDDIQFNVTRITLYSAELETNVTRLNNEVNSIANIVEPLFDDIDSFISLISCSFLGRRYYQLKIAACQDIATSFIMLSLCFFIIGLTGIPGMILSIVLMKRIKRPLQGMAAQERQHLAGGRTPVQQIVVMQPMHMQNR